MIAKAFKLGAIGCLLGMIVGVVIVIAKGFATGGGELVLPDSLVAATGSESGALLAHMLISGAFGAIPWAGIVIYEIDSWGLLKQALRSFSARKPLKWAFYRGFRAGDRGIFVKNDPNCHPSMRQFGAQSGKTDSVASRHGRLPPVLSEK